MFSICLCAWNDLNYLKILHKGILRNSKIPFEFIVHDNNSTDGTEEWLQTNNIKYSKSKTNEGVAAVNYAVEQATFPYIININADMYPLPNWDIEILKQIQKFKNDNIEKFIISSCLVEPYGGNPEYIPANFGRNYSNFREEKLLKEYCVFINKKKTECLEQNTIQYSHRITL